MKFFYCILLLGVCIGSNAQKSAKKFETNIGKAEAVKVMKTEGLHINEAGNINLDVKHYQYGDVVISPTTSKAKLYLLDVRGRTIYRLDSSNKNVEDSIITEFSFGNPDNEVTKDVRLVLSFSKSFDTVHFQTPFFIDNKGNFNPYAIRDSYTTVSADKKTITFSAGYIGAGTIVKIKIVSLPSIIGQKITVEGIGKLF